MTPRQLTIRGLLRVCGRLAVSVVSVAVRGRARERRLERQLARTAAELDATRQALADIRSDRERTAA